MVEITANASTVKIEGACTIAQLLETYSRVTHSVYSALRGSGLPEDAANDLVMSAAAVGTDSDAVEPRLSIRAIMPRREGTLTANYWTAESVKSKRIFRNSTSML